ncbi:MAG: stage II sporulation protein M [Acidobacteria bacterium]|nr:stage II sporulation protein M [Acidobacteriota bacterium]
MSTNRFIREGKNAWQRLEDLLMLLDRSSLRRLHREEVRELGRIYRRTASDLAIARAESRDPRLINYLNSLVIRAHGRIYRADAQGGQRIRKFFTRDFPQTFRRTWRYTALAFAVFWIFAAAAFIGTWRDPDFSEFAGIPPVFRHAINSKTHWWEELNEANQIGSSAILTNNIQVTFNAFALGAIFGIGTLYYMAFNGAMLGAVFALVYRADAHFGFEFLSFVVGHGMIELSCIYIAGGAGMLIGYALLAPGDLTRADALKKRGREAVILIAACVPLLVIAGIIEGFISPAPISPVIKFSISIITGIALYSYLLFAGHEPKVDKVKA